jgi:hypothetical protein
MRSGIVGTGRESELGVTVGRMSVIGVAVIVVAACAGQPATPPPAEPYTSFAPAEVKVKSDPDWMVTGFGSVWVKRPQGFVDRIDAQATTVAAEIRVHETGDAPCEGIGSSASAIWACDTGDLVRVEPATNDTVAPIPAGKIAVQGRLVAASGRIWVLTGDGDQLAGVDEASGEVGDPIGLPVACNDLGAFAEVIYVVCEGADRVLRVDLTTRSVTAQAEINAPNWVSAAGSGVWVTAGDDLLHVDPVSLKTIDTVPGLGTGQFGSIWANASGVWIRKFDPFLTYVDASGAIHHTIIAPFKTGGDVVGDGQHLWVSAIDDQLVIRLDVPAGT